MTAPYRKKLIEVAIPLEAINRESGREKSIRHGHPATLHLWWARRPLAAARAILFAQLVDDPSGWPERFPTESEQDTERKRLFRILEGIVSWEGAADAEALYRARFEIAQSWARDHRSELGAKILALNSHDLAQNSGRALVDEYVAGELPKVHDPFAGGGSIPLEAQRLGLRTIATDLNPVAVLINKALVELPPRFRDRAPSRPVPQSTKSAKGNVRSKKQRALALENEWTGTSGLAADINFYGSWLREEAKRRIGHLYPDVEITSQLVADRPDLEPLKGTKLPALAWLWARTVASPDPAFAGAHVPLVASYWLSTKPGKETWIEPKVISNGYTFTIRRGAPLDRDAISRGTKSQTTGFTCILSGAPITFDYVRSEAAAGRLRERLMAIVAEGPRSRVYVAATPQDEALALSAVPQWEPEGELPEEALGFRVQRYGLRRWADLYTRRQLVALTTFADLVKEAHARVLSDSAGRNDATEYAKAIALYLSFSVSRMTDYACTIATWASNPQMEIIRNTFARQAIPMTWDFAESNPFASSSGSLEILLGWIEKAVQRLPAAAQAEAFVHDITSTSHVDQNVVISTDPPYYDNIGYADLSDFFYVWLRPMLRELFQQETSTLLVPKKGELIAASYRHGGKAQAEQYFLDGMTQALTLLRREGIPSVPLTIYYAFKQSETGGEGTASTGWETFLEAVVRSGFEIRGTWPVRTERSGRSRDIGSNALATSVVLAIAPRRQDATTATRADFRRSLREELPLALRALQASRIAPVDIPQAAIGPGMAVFSRFAKVLEPDGAAMSVRAALRLINEVLDEFLSEQEGEFDSDTRFAVTWYEAHAFDAGAYGEAEKLAMARAVAVSGIAEAGIVKSGGGKVRLLTRAELPPNWDPKTDTRLTVWEATQHLVKRLEENGETSAAQLLDALGATGDAARDLAYRLYTVCDRKGWAEEARAYNSLVVAWADLERLASKSSALPSQQDLL